MDKVVAMCTTSNRFPYQIVDVHHDYAHDAEKGDAKAQACVNAIINSQVALSNAEGLGESGSRPGSSRTSKRQPGAALRRFFCLHRQSVKLGLEQIFAFQTHSILFSGFLEIDEGARACL